MKLPLVSRRRFALLQHNFRKLRTELHIAKDNATHFRVDLGSAEAEIASLREQLEEERKSFHALLDKYHELRQDGHSAPPPSPVVQEPFGPLTRAALHDMSVGQSGMVKRKMREKAQLLWLEQRNQANQDEVVSIAVRQGEKVLL